jgi:hypothetical protein
MSSTGASIDYVTETPDLGTVDMRLEVVALPVADVDRAKRFYESLGCGGWMPTSSSATPSGWYS